MRTALCGLFFLLSICLGQTWKQSSDGFFTVETASTEDEAELPKVFSILEDAKNDLKRQGLYLPSDIILRIHPDLESFLEATQVPWFIAGLSDRSLALIQIQRLAVLKERSSLRITLRHELYHLAQPEYLPRWKAEGSAMLFAGEVPTAKPFAAISEVRLEHLLASPGSSEEFKQAMATAYLWVKTKKE